MHWSDVWEGGSVGARLARAGMLPLSGAYALGWCAYEMVYRLGLKRPSEPHSPVVCIGNLRIGGSGKTPLVLFVAERLRARGREMAISCSGYGSPRERGARVAPNGPLDPREWGDEATLLREATPETPLIVGRSRVEAARLCHERFANAVLLMDDGLQHLPLRKHVSIVVDPPGGNGLPMPSGPYRQPRSRRSSFDLCLPGRYAIASELTCDRPLAGLRANVLCAIGAPQRFLEDLRAAGVEIAATRFAPDHDPLTAGTLFEGMPGHVPILVTTKDWVKLRNRSDLAGRDVHVVQKRVWLDPAEEFDAWLLNRLDEFSKT